MQYKFSLAKPTDATEILALYQSLIGTPGCAYNSYYPAMEDVESDIKNSALYTIKNGDAIIAAATLNTHENPCTLHRLSVTPSLQSRGIGKMLLNEVIKIARAKHCGGIEMLVSKTNPPALALYDKNGFTRCGETSMHGIDFYCYEIKFDTATEAGPV